MRRRCFRRRCRGPAPAHKRCNRIQCMPLIRDISGRDHVPLASDHMCRRSCSNRPSFDERVEDQRHSIRLTDWPVLAVRREGHQLNQLRARGDGWTLYRSAINRYRSVIACGPAFFAILHFHFVAMLTVAASPCDWLVFCRRVRNGVGCGESGAGDTRLADAAIAMLRPATLGRDILQRIPQHLFTWGHD